LAAWKVVGLGFGIASMLWGAIGALRHRDAKLILAWGTVSQLGLMITLLATGTGKAVFAATSILFAHALFKAALFAVVGEIDVRTGTRDITELGGLSRTMPVATAVAVLAGASMAGVPPLLGFAAKEAAVEAVLGLSGLEALIVGGAVIGGSVLTVAYTTRFLLTVFGPGPDTPVKPPRPAMTVPSVVLAGLGLLGFILINPVNEIVIPAAVELNEKASVYELFRWPGLTTGLMVSFGIVGFGAALGWYLANRGVPRLPRPLGADAADGAVDGVLELSPRLIGRIQHGSLPVYLVTMTLAAALATIPLLSDLSSDHLVLWNEPIQAVLVAGLLVAAGVGVLVESRLGAALTLGAVGISVSGLFVVHGAPDLALTQLLVETVVVVGFVIGLGHLTRRFPAAEPTWRAVRIGVSAAIGLGVALALASAGGNPTGSAPIDELADGSVDVGGGNNIVNVILTDIRALDTVGEVIVLAVVAVGILALANVRKAETAT
jgi:multicomponent Na+:H+ antiporter subunit A